MHQGRNRKTKNNSLSTVAQCFATNQIDEDWLWIIENRIGVWVSSKPSEGYWNYVNILGQADGVLKRGLTRQKFADLIVTCCPKALPEGKTASQLKWNMDDMPITVTPENIGTWGETTQNGICLGELRSLFDQEIPASRPAGQPTATSRLLDYVRKWASTDPLAKIIVHPTYCGFTPTFSVEKYLSKRFYDQGMPTSITVFEYVAGKVTPDMVIMYKGRYSTNSDIKTVIFSESSFKASVQSLAIERHVALMRIDPRYEVTEDCFTTPRMDGINTALEIEKRMLRGDIPMTVPVVIDDCTRMTTSLVDFLTWCGIDVKDNEPLHAPQLTQDYIEAKAMMVVHDQVEAVMAVLSLLTPADKVPKCIIDLDRLVRERRLRVKRCNLSRQHHLGNYNMWRREINLNKGQRIGSGRDRFSQAHEIGHDVLHTDLRFREFMCRDAQRSSEAASDIWEKRWLDRQANRFASYLLMPKPIVEKLYSLYWQKWFGRGEATPMVVERNPYWNTDFQNVVDPIARKMGVSSEAMLIRLVDLGLLVEVQVYE